MYIDTYSSGHIQKINIYSMEFDAMEHYVRDSYSLNGS